LGNDRQGKNKVITLFGPTASGKTALAILLAQKLNGVIVNADSRQFYKHMSIIVAMPSEEEFSAAPHMLFNMLDPAEKLSVTQYVSMVRDAVDNILSQGKLPIICGGTGFYLKALMDGISNIPSTDQTVLARLGMEFPASNPSNLWDAVNKVDAPSAARLNVNDRQRLLRALCVFDQTGTALSVYQSRPLEGALDVDFISLALNPPRDVLRSRIDLRFDIMMKAGLVNEVENLKELGYTADDHGMQSVGVREFFSYIEGKLALDEAKNLMLNQTKQYAKRQSTWLRNQYPALLVFESCEEGIASLASIQKLLTKSTV